MRLELKRIPDSKFFLIPVTNSSIKESSKVTSIKCGDDIYNVYDRFTYNKKEFIPLGVLRIATGIEKITVDKIWSNSPKADKLIIFVVSKNIDSNKIP